jgi:hypothetical protein
VDIYEAIFQVSHIYSLHCADKREVKVYLGSLREVLVGIIQEKMKEAMCPNLDSREFPDED